MANILDYLIWRGDLTLAERPFNEVDNLILSELCYLDFGGIVPEPLTDAVSLREAAERYFSLHPTTDMGVLVPNTIPALLREAAASRRFGEMRLCGYRSALDTKTEIQFAALCVCCGDGCVYLAFRGTDDTIVGWKEDFNMAFMPTVPAQQQAAQYLSRAAAAFPAQVLRVGGHSKGGNLAVYASVCCTEREQNQISAVYNNDGPGLHQRWLDSDGHRRAASKIHTIVPESSVVGMLLEHEERYTVVRSTQTGLFQHDGFSWQVRCDCFEQLPSLDENGRFISRTLHTFLYALSDEQREQFVSVLYDVLTCTDAATLTELKQGGLKTASAMLRTLRALDKPTRSVILQTLKLLFKTGVLTAEDALSSPDRTKTHHLLEALSNYLESRGTKSDDDHSDLT